MLVHYSASPRVVGCYGGGGGSGGDDGSGGGRGQIWVLGFFAAHFALTGEDQDEMNNFLGSQQICFPHQFRYDLSPTLPMIRLCSLPHDE